MGLEYSVVDLGVVQLKIGLYSSPDDLLTLKVSWNEGSFLLRLVEDLQHLLEVISDDRFATLFRLFILLSLWREAVMSLKGKDGKRDRLSADCFLLSLLERAHILKFRGGKGHTFGKRKAYWLIKNDLIKNLRREMKNKEGYSLEDKGKNFLEFSWRVSIFCEWWFEPQFRSISLIA